jgi:Mg2+ and Co2+ transporter CorA
MEQIKGIFVEKLHNEITPVIQKCMDEVTEIEQLLTENQIKIELSCKLINKKLKDIKKVRKKVRKIAE